MTEMTFQIPDISAFGATAREAAAEYAEAEHQVQVELAPLRKQLRARQRELEQELGVGALQKRAEAEAEAAAEAAREAILAFAEAAWKGHMGEGTPVVLKDEGELRLAKILDFTSREQVKAEIEEKGILPVHDGRAYARWTGNWAFLSFLRKEEGIVKPGNPWLSEYTSGAKAWRPDVVEVGWADPSTEELAQLLARVKRGRKLNVVEIIKVFGDAANFQVGETFEIADDWGDDDRATLVAKVVYLPTSRWALITCYQWQESEPEWRSHGVVDPNVSVDLDAKFREVSVEGQELQPLTEEEVAFLVEKFGQLADDEE